MTPRPEQQQEQAVGRKQHQAEAAWIQDLTESVATTADSDADAETEPRHRVQGRQLLDHDGVDQIQTVGAERHSLTRRPAYRAMNSNGLDHTAGDRNSKAMTTTRAAQPSNSTSHCSIPRPDQQLAQRPNHLTRDYKEEEDRHSESHEEHTEHQAQ
jgi:hypothetical protein